jgi:hypothetical protein
MLLLVLPLEAISNDGSERRIAPKALDRFKERIRELTSRTRGLSLSQIIEELTPYLIGWRSYFGFCQTPRARSQLLRQRQSGFRMHQRAFEIHQRVSAKEGGVIGHPRDWLLS